MLRIRSTLRFKIASSNLPSFTALTIASYCLSSPGCSMSFPASICATASLPPNQSVITIPLNPHSSRKRVVSSSGFSEV